MALSVKNRNPSGNGPKDVPAKGTHIARLVGLTDLGHQPGFEYKGKEIPSSFKIEFTYELVNSLMEDGRPHWVSEEVSVNDFEGDLVVSTMMARVRAIDKENDTKDGKELEKMLSKPCMLTLSINEKGYPKLRGQAAVSGIPSGMQVPELQNPIFVFDLADDSPEAIDMFENFPEFKQKKVRAALNFMESPFAKALAENGDI